LPRFVVKAAVAGLVTQAKIVGRNRQPRSRDRDRLGRNRRQRPSLDRDRAAARELRERRRRNFLGAPSAKLAACNSLRT
jgi:hypothetical protein